jgi:oligopeptide/dipeptide ABC transporter ATP-binding protein
VTLTPEPPGPDAPHLVATGLSKTFVVRRDLLGRPSRTVAAVADVSLTIAPGETLGLVGESGSGKSTVGRLIAQLIRADTGTVLLAGENLGAMPPKQRRKALRDIQVVFQDPFASLDPSWIVGNIVTEGLRAHGLVSRRDREDRAVELLELVGLRADHVRRYSYEFSGGQRQRIAIARALAVHPRVLICDEAVSALDVSTQAAILVTLEELQERLGLSYLFISHDLGVVRHVSDRIAVMYLGRIVEEGAAADVYDDPCHPYTKALLAAIPQVRPRTRVRITATGDLPDPADAPSGCSFHTRCPDAVDVCRAERPLLVAAAAPRLAACHLTVERPADRTTEPTPASPA